MMELLSSFQTIQQRLPVLVLLDAKPEMDAAYQQVKQKLGEEKSLQPLTVQESERWVDLARNALSSGKWDDLKSREMKNISSCLWYGQNPLAADENFLRKFLGTCENRIKKSLCHALIWVYLYNYERGKLGIALLGEWLATVVNRWDWSWADRQKELSLFGNHNSALSVLGKVMNGKSAVADILESYGMAGTLQSGGMVSTAFVEALKQYGVDAKSLGSEELIPSLERILEWATLGGQKFSYPKLRPLFIESLLLPWANTTPDDKVVNMTQGFLLAQFHHPRSEKGGSPWRGVHEVAEGVILRWLVKRALEQFLDVVDETAQDDQWKYRRAFWMAYYRKGVISDAWVAFAANGIAKAQEIARRHNDSSWLSFGNLHGGGDPSHAVLILRIGNLIIADFSHNGKCRLWDSQSERAPRPYGARYERKGLLDSEAKSEHIHSNSSGYLWQGRVVAEIHKATGIKMTQKEYTPL